MTIFCSDFLVINFEFYLGHDVEHRQDQGLRHHHRVRFGKLRDQDRQLEQRGGPKDRRPQDRPGGYLHPGIKKYTRLGL